MAARIFWLRQYDVSGNERPMSAGLLSPVTPGTNIVVPVSTATNKPGRPIKVGIFPDLITVTPDGKTAFVATENAVYPVFTATGHVGRLIRTNFSPAAIAITPDDRTAWVTVSGAGYANDGSPSRCASHACRSSFRLGCEPERRS
jgi:DNA-binding beta-propeller fold protein YncE